MWGSCGVMQLLKALFGRKRNRFVSVIYCFCGFKAQLRKGIGLKECRAAQPRLNCKRNGRKALSQRLGG